MINHIMFWEWTCSVLCYHNNTFLLRSKGHLTLSRVNSLTSLLGLCLHLHHSIYPTVTICQIREASYKLPLRS